MTRTIEEWRGKTDDAAIPPRVQLRVFRMFKGICPECTRKMLPGKWQCDHIVALVNGGQHRERNLQPLCTTPCHSDKTKADVAEKSRIYKRAASFVGIEKRRGPQIQSRGFEKRAPQRTATRPVVRRSAPSFPS